MDLAEVWRPKDGFQFKLETSGSRFVCKNLILLEVWVVAVGVDKMPCSRVPGMSLCFNPCTEQRHNWAKVESTEAKAEELNPRRG